MATNRLKTGVEPTTETSYMLNIAQNCSVMNHAVSRTVGSHVIFREMLQRAVSVGSSRHMVCVCV